MTVLAIKANFRMFGMREINRMIGGVSFNDIRRIDLFFNSINYFFAVILEFTAQDDQKSKQKNQDDTQGSKVQNESNMSIPFDFHEY